MLSRRICRHNLMTACICVYLLFILDVWINRKTSWNWITIFLFITLFRSLDNRRKLQWQLMQIDFRNPFVVKFFFASPEFFLPYMCDKFMCCEMQALLNCTTDGITIHNAAITINKDDSSFLFRPNSLSTSVTHVKCDLCMPSSTAYNGRPNGSIDFAKTILPLFLLFLQTQSTFLL